MSATGAMTISTMCPFALILFITISIIPPVVYAGISRLSTLEQLLQLPDFFVQLFDSVLDHRGTVEFECLGGQVHLLG